MQLRRNLLRFVLRVEEKIANNFFIASLIYGVLIASVCVLVQFIMASTLSVTIGKDLTTLFPAQFATTLASDLNWLSTLIFSLVVGSLLFPGAQAAASFRMNDAEFDLYRVGVEGLEITQTSANMVDIQIAKQHASKIYNTNLATFQTNTANAAALAEAVRKCIDELPIFRYLLGISLIFWFCFYPFYIFNHHYTYYALFLDTFASSAFQGVQMFLGYYMLSLLRKQTVDGVNYFKNLLPQ